MTDERDVFNHSLRRLTEAPLEAIGDASIENGVRIKRFAQLLESVDVKADGTTWVDRKVGEKDNGAVTVRVILTWGCGSGAARNAYPWLEQQLALHIRSLLPDMVRSIIGAEAVALTKIVEAGRE